MIVIEVICNIAKHTINKLIAILYEDIFPIFPPSAMPRGQEDPTPLANADTEDSNEESPYVLRCLGAFFRP
jgi:hypothetical protein